MSSRTGGQKKKAQKHKNDYAYIHQKQSALTQKISQLPVHGLCSRCVEQILWRKQFGKYKPLSVPKKCVGCQMKTVKEAYHILCNPCAKAKKVCAKCQTSNEIVTDPSEYKTDAQTAAEQQNYDNWLKSLPERKRRTVLRKIQKGEDVQVGEVESDDDLDFGSDLDDEDFGSDEE